MSTNPDVQAYRVQGWSMWPTLAEGSTVVVLSAARCSAVGQQWPPEVGAIVVARHPFRRGLAIVKRVAGVDAAGRFELRGDASIESEDSGSLGSFELEALVGRVVGRMHAAVTVT